MATLKLMLGAGALRRAHCRAQARNAIEHLQESESGFPSENATNYDARAVFVFFETKIA
jgi:hypothetical protein